MVPAKQPGPEFLHDQRDDRRLQEGDAEEPSHNSQDLWNPSGETTKLQVPWYPHLRGPDMDHTYLQPGEEGGAAPVPPQIAEEIQDLHSAAGNLLQHSS